MAQEQWLRAFYPYPQAAGRKGEGTLGLVWVFKTSKTTSSGASPLESLYFLIPILLKQFHSLEITHSGLSVYGGIFILRTSDGKQADDVCSYIHKCLAQGLEFIEPYCLFELLRSYGLMGKIVGKGKMQKRPHQTLGNPHN